ncbi:helix-turn-helix domain-containing protein [Chloroflexota bacterium]
MKQVELAKQLGVSKSYLSMILNGQRMPNPELARKISSLEVHKTEPVSPCKGGALPAKLQPHLSSIIATKGLIRNLAEWLQKLDRLKVLCCVSTCTKISEAIS